MLNFFDNVLPNVVPVDEDEIDITLDVFEKSTGQANLSMGYNELHGFTGGGGFEFPNFRGRGQTLSISYNRGLTGQNSSSSSSYSSSYSSTSSPNQSSYQSFSVSYTEPWLFDTPNLVGVSFFYTEKGQGNPKSILDNIPKNLPSLLKAQKLQKKAAKEGFDWTQIDDVFKKLDEEVAEFKEAVLKKSNTETRT